MSYLQSLLEIFDNLKMGKRKGQHAPHKPLLILYALSELQRGQKTFAYRDVDPALTSLLKTFGPQRVSHHSEYPFWRLQNDGIWIVTADAPLESRKSNSDAKKSELIQKNAIGAFSPSAMKTLMAHPQNIRTVAKWLLEANFPESLHHDILDAVGLNLEVAGNQQRRSPDFRRRVLRAYESRCCVCGYDMRLGDNSAGLEAAHIMWHQVGGPDKESNGLALCVLHHKAFDLGAFAIDDDGQTVVCSQELSGTTRTEWLLAFHGTRLKRPQSVCYFPERKFLEWHRVTIFKGPGRDFK
ncbi:MAG: HNH endonuclease [Gammaproteobacteria bacterium]|nr:HNH endonuclease [Gammaproteobacteria bacterium]